MKILVLGYVVRCPFGGMTWHYLNYVAGLAALGHDVYFLEDSDEFEGCCYDPTTQTNITDPTIGLDYAGPAFEALGLAERWGYFDWHTNTWHGPIANRVEDAIDGADMLINISGSNPARDWFGRVPVRVFIDTDPAFEQVRQVTVRDRRLWTDAHNRFLTFGFGVANNSARVPDDGRNWRFTRQPIALEFWPRTASPTGGPYTTVMQWDSYPTRSYDGVEYGMKSHSFGPYFDLPQHVDAPMALALSGSHAPAKRLNEAGWQLHHGPDVTRDIWTYRDFLRRSRGEFAVAKHGYVTSRCGWFSERSACYLASGRPVVTQSTGFEDWLPTGEGLLSFRDATEAAAAIAEIEADYDRHARAARAIAEDEFASDRVLTDLLEAVA